MLYCVLSKRFEGGCIFREEKAARRGEGAFEKKNRKSQPAFLVARIFGCYWIWGIGVFCKATNTHIGLLQSGLL